MCRVKGKGHVIVDASTRGRAIAKLYEQGIATGNDVVSAFPCHIGVVTGSMKMPKQETFKVSVMVPAHFYVPSNPDIEDGEEVVWWPDTLNAVGVVPLSEVIYAE